MNEQLQAGLDRYELGDKIGQGGQGITYHALDRNTGEAVVVKELRVEHLDDWKSVELFEREGEALQALDHPAIPAYVDHFHLNSADSSRLFLVQEYVEGRDLAHAIDDGLRLTEAEVVDLVAKLLEILKHIHALDPPIIHRDIKPANILLREDYSLALVDFGAARTVLEGAAGGSTVVGTSGYMPLEQLMGRAHASTDLYAVGATAIHLLSHKHPADIDVLQMKLQFHDDINVSDGLEGFLDKLVEPHVEDRYQTADEAIAALRQIGAAAPEQKAPQNKQAPAPLEHAPTQGGAQVGGVLGSAVEGMAAAAQRTVQSQLGWAQGFFEGQSYDRPRGSLWNDLQRDGHRVIQREPTGPGSARNTFVGAAVILGLVLTSITLFVFGDDWDLPSTGSPEVAMVVTGVFAIVGLIVLYKGALDAWGIEEFELTPNEIIHRTKVFSHEMKKVIDVDDVTEIDMTWDTVSSGSGSNRRSTTYYYFVVDTGSKQQRFGKDMTKDEKLWAASAIREHVAAHEDSVRSSP